ncbi:echinoidin-like [Diadema setosum]|uniref:echinoidin-like n=1 Tax=Diadema setosum TaxID=31175 RepID=UPI003B3A1E92
MCRHIFSEKAGGYIKLTPKYVPLDHPIYHAMVPREAKGLTNLYCAHPEKCSKSVVGDQAGGCERACIPNPCLNGRNCSETLEDFECDCGYNLLGKTCATPCPAGWSPQNLKSESCYLYRYDSLSWTAARDSCVQLGGYLVAIQTPEEMTSVREYLTSTYGSDAAENFWIGLNDRSEEGSFTWTAVGGVLPLASTMWHSGEPNNDGYDEDCTEMVGNGFNDLPCRLLLPYICELEI